MRLLLSVLLVLLLPGSAARVRAEDAEPLAKALARPISPAAVALLLPHASEAGAIARLVEALGDPRPEVRAVAARVAFVTRHQGLVTALVTALEKEDANSAGAEVVRALALIRGEAADALVLPALERLGPGAAVAWLGVVARTRSGDLVSRLARLPDGMELEATTAVGRLLQSNPEAGEQILAELGRDAVADKAYGWLMLAGMESFAELPWPMLRAGLAVPAHRASVVALLYRRHLRGSSVPSEAPAALGELDRQVGGEDDPWTRLLLDLGLRAQGHPVRPLTVDADRLDPAAAPAGVAQHRLLELLEPGELPGLRALVPVARHSVDGGPLVATPLPRGPFKTASPAAATTASDGSTTRTPRPLVSMLARELATLTGCRPGATQMAVLGVSYRPTGQVRNIQTRLAAPDERCTRAAQLLAALDVAPGEGRIADSRVDLVFAGFRPADVSCDRAPMRARRTARMGETGVTPPRKTRQVNPHYPKVAQDAGVQGVVVLDALIQSDGCVADAIVLRSVDPALDLAALLAVTQWQYEPARRDGEVIPVLMTVTVNFTLH